MAGDLRRHAAHGNVTFMPLEGISNCSQILENDLAMIKPFKNIGDCRFLSCNLQITDRRWKGDNKVGGSELKVSKWIIPSQMNI